MPRAKKTTVYDASAEVIRKYFEQSWAAREEQKAASGVISSLNSEMTAVGVHAGVLSWMRKIKAMAPGKRGFHLYLLRRYADVLESELHDPAFRAPEQQDNVAPFDRQTRAA
jgi:hypothetical protein